MYERFVQLMEERGVTPYRIYKDTGVSQSVLSAWKKGASVPRPLTLRILADYFGVSVAYLKGLTDERGAKEKPVVVGEELADMSLVKFPVIGSIAAGYNCCAIEEYTGDYAYFPSSELTAPAEEYFVLRVKGDSMYPKLLDGDLVLVRRKTNIESGKIAVVLYNAEEATLKKVNYVYGQDWLELLPINPEYQAKRIEGAELEQCRVLGEVVKLQRDL